MPGHAFSSQLAGRRRTPSRTASPKTIALCDGRYSASPASRRRTPGCRRAARRRWRRFGCGRVCSCVSPPAPRSSCRRSGRRCLGAPLVIHGDDDRGRTVGVDVPVERVPEACGVGLFGRHLRIDQHECVVADERVGRDHLIPSLAVLAAVLGFSPGAGRIVPRCGRSPRRPCRSASAYGSGYGVSGPAPAVRLQVDDRALSGLRPRSRHAVEREGFTESWAGGGSGRAAPAAMSIRSTRRRGGSCSSSSAPSSTSRGSSPIWCSRRRSPGSRLSARARARAVRDARRGDHGAADLAEGGPRGPESLHRALRRSGRACLCVSGPRGRRRRLTRDLTSLGFSRGKARYVLELARSDLDLHSLSSLSDDEVKAELTGSRESASGRPTGSSLGTSRDLRLARRRPRPAVRGLRALW